MGFIGKIRQVFIEPLIEEKNEGLATARAFKSALAAACAHIQALLGLLNMELRNAAKRLGRKFAWLVIGLFAAFFFYVFLWCLIVALIACVWNLVAALAVAAGFHLLAAVAAFAGFDKTRVTPLAPAALEELKTDLTCLQMTLKKDSNS